MGLWKKVKKAAKRAGKAVKRSVAVAAPVLLGPGLGEKAGVAVSRTAGKTARKSTLAYMGRVSRVTGKVVQVAGTAVATVFGGPAAGAGAYRVSGTMAKLGQYTVKSEQYRAGYTHTKPRRVNWGSEALGLGLAVGAAGAVQAGAELGEWGEQLGGIVGGAARQGEGILTRGALGGSLGGTGGAGYEGQTGAPGGDDVLILVAAAIGFLFLVKT
jgi:hypothetical protein